MMFVTAMFTVDNEYSTIVLKRCINHLMKMAEVFEYTHIHDFNPYTTVDTW